MTTSLGGVAANSPASMHADTADRTAAESCAGFTTAMLMTPVRRFSGPSGISHHCSHRWDLHLARFPLRRPKSVPKAAHGPAQAVHETAVKQSNRGPSPARCQAPAGEEAGPVDRQP